MARAQQRGFVRSSVTDLLFLFFIILVCLAVWGTFRTTILEGDFTLAFFMCWLVAIAVTGWWTREQTLVLRIPAGLLLFLGAALVLAPLSWWSGSKLATGVEAAVPAVAAIAFGKLWSGRLARRLDGKPPWWLDQSINLVNDFLRWVFACIIAWFAVVILPLLLIFVLPLEWIAWAALVWAFACMTWYVFKFRPSRVRFLKVPLGLWVFGIAAVALKVFQQQFVGTMEAGSIGLIAYMAYQPLVIALFTEIAVVGTKK